MAKLSLPRGWLAAQIQSALAKHPAAASGDEPLSAWAPPKSTMPSKAAGGGGVPVAGNSSLIALVGLCGLGLLLWGWRTSSKRRGYAKAGEFDVEP